jgi:hypothetical protein
LRWQAGGEAGNATEVASEHHSATKELEDAEAAPDDGWRRLSAVVHSTAHDTEDRHGGSHPRSMAASCRVREAHHVGTVLGVVPVGLGGGVERLTAGGVLAVAGPCAGWFS